MGLGLEYAHECVCVAQTREMYLGRCVSHVRCVFVCIYIYLSTCLYGRNEECALAPNVPDGKMNGIHTAQQTLFTGDNGADDNANAGAEAVVAP